MTNLLHSRLFRIVFIGIGLLAIFSSALGTAAQESTFDPLTLPNCDIRFNAPSTF